MGIQRKGRYRSILDVHVADMLRIAFKLQTKGEVSEIDKIGMKKNFREIRNLLTIMAGIAVMGVFGKGEDDDDEESFLSRMLSMNILINLFNRVKTDIMFYSNPVEFQRLMKDAIPLMSLITDSVSLAQSLLDFVKGNDTIEKGIYAGQSNLFRQTMKTFPVSSSVYKIYNNSVQQFRKDKSFMQSFLEEKEPGEE